MWPFKSKYSCNFCRDTGVLSTSSAISYCHYCRNIAKELRKASRHFIQELNKIKENLPPAEEHQEEICRCDCGDIVFEFKSKRQPNGRYIWKMNGE